MTHPHDRFDATAVAATEPASPPARIALVALLAGSLPLVCASVRGQSPAFAYSGSFSSGALSAPADVAPFAHCDRAKWTFVADSGQHHVQRFHSNGASGLVTATSSIGFADGPFGIAVNDLPGHCNYGQVYVTDYAAAGPGFVYVFNSSLNLLKQVALTGSGFGKPNGIAVDAKGDVYVADTQNNATYRFDSAAFGAPFFVSTVVTPEITIGRSYGLPTDVSVDHNYRVHVVNTCGCLTVFDADGTLVNPGGAVPNIPGQLGVDALSPTADTFLTRSPGSSYPGGDFMVYDWPLWVPQTSGSSGLTYGSTTLATPRGLEFQKLTRTTVLASGMTRTFCAPLMFVADGGNHRTAVFAAPTLVSAPLPVGAVAWWRMEDVHQACSGTAAIVRDAIGSNDGTSYGAAIPRTVEGLVRCGLETENGQASVRVPDAPALNFGQGSFSIEGWLRTEQVTGTITVLDKRVGTGAGYAVFITNGRLGVQTNIGGNTYQNFSPTNPLNFVADGKWHHFTAIVERELIGVAALFIDCDLVGSTPALLGNIDNTGDLFLGRVNPSAGGTALRGAIDEITLYDRALSENDLDQICAAHCAGKEFRARRIYCSGSLGDPVSLQQAPLTAFGFGAAATQNRSLADDFSVCGSMTIEEVELFAYQTLATTTSTITGVYLQFYDGDPGLGGMPIPGSPGPAINLLTAQSDNAFSGIYRASELSPENTDRPIMKMRVALPTPLTLSTGVYWLEMQFEGSLPSGPWVPPITVSGQTVTGDALQRTGSSWSNLTSGAAPGFGQGLPFWFYGTASSSPGSITDVGLPSCGTTIVCEGAPVPGGFVRTTLPASTTLGVIGYGLTQAALPYCGCTVGHEWAVLTLGNANTLDIPLNPTLCGIEVRVQGLALLGQGGCPAFSNTMQIRL